MMSNTKKKINHLVKRIERLGGYVFVDENDLNHSKDFIQHSANKLSELYKQEISFFEELKQFFDKEAVDYLLKNMQERVEMLDEILIELEIYDGARELRQSDLFD